MDSVDAAKAYQAAERARVEQATGIRFQGDALVPPRIVLIPCVTGTCLYVAGGADESEAFEKLEGHLVRRHGIQAPKEIA